MAQQSKFDIWWNSYKIKRIFSAVYSLGAAIVILGAMFKILHLPGGGTMLAIGMSTEVIVFALGIFDKPFKEWDWEKVFDFSAGEKLNSNGLQPSMQTNQPTGLSLKTTAMLESDVEKLSEGIKTLTGTAQQLTNLTSVVDVTEKFVKTIENASVSTRKYTQSQDSLNAEVERLHASYTGVAAGMDVVEKNTKQYSSKIEDINRNLSSINSIYEIQLKNIHTQSESLNLQSEAMRKATDELNAVLAEIKKIKAATSTAVDEAESFRTGATGLSRQIADLNKIYGNMLNALS
jgi:gliding motility-associated protein GldL